MLNAEEANQEIGQPRGRKEANQKIGQPREREGAAPRWHSRGYLPHFESASVIQHVTFHLADSLPRDVVNRLNEELQRLPPEQQDPRRRERIQAWMDAGHGSCILREPVIAEMVQNSLLAFDSERYHMLAWVVMPNHVHALFQPMGEWTVAKIVASWKKFTARRICDYRRGVWGWEENRENTSRETGGPRESVWHREYWDRFVRDDRHLSNVVEYIHLNPVKAGLVGRAHDWRWSSAYSGE